MIAGLLAIAGAWLMRAGLRPNRSSSSGRTMLAVLPFANLTGDAAQEYFSDGLTEEMINQFGRLSPQRIGVIARTSVMAYKGSRQQLRRIGSELGVQYVLEGSVRRAPDRVRISAQLVRVGDQTQLWAQEYDRQLENLLNLQGEIAQEVAAAIQLALGQERAAPQARPVYSPPSYEAYDLYLKGLYFLNERNPKGLLQAVQCFERATSIDPK